MDLKICIGALLNEVFQSDPVDRHVIWFLLVRVGEPEQTVSRTMTARQGLWAKGTGRNCPASYTTSRDAKVKSGEQKRRVWSAIAASMTDLTTQPLRLCLTMV